MFCREFCSVLSFPLMLDHCLRRRQLKSHAPACKCSGSSHGPLARTTYTTLPRGRRMGNWGDYIGNSEQKFLWDRHKEIFHRRGDTAKETYEEMLQCNQGSWLLESLQIPFYLHTHWQQFKSLTTPNIVDRSGEQQTNKSPFADGRANWNSHFGRQFGLLLKSWTCT